MTVLKSLYYLCSVVDTAFFIKYEFLIRVKGGRTLCAHVQAVMVGASNFLSDIGVVWNDVFGYKKVKCVLSNLVEEALFSGYILLTCGEESEIVGLEFLQQFVVFVEVIVKVSE